MFHIYHKIKFYTSFSTFKKPSISDFVDYYFIKTLNFNKPKSKSNNKFYTQNYNLTINFKKEIQDIKIKNRNILKEKYYLYIQNKLSKVNWKALLDFKNSQDYIHKIFLFLTRHIGTYKASIQELVEGQREVIYNDDFKFEDGETAKQKTEKFEGKFKENFSVRDLTSKIKGN